MTETSNLDALYANVVAARETVEEALKRRTIAEQVYADALAEDQGIANGTRVSIVKSIGYGHKRKTQVRIYKVFGWRLYGVKHLQLRVRTVRKDGTLGAWHDLYEYEHILPEETNHGA